MATWQQILALDAKYNPYRSQNNPQFRTLYIRRRSQLLRESASNHELKSGSPDGNAQVRRQYIRLRAQLLAQRYGNPLGLNSSTGVPSDCGVNGSSLRSRSVSLASQSLSRSTLCSPDDEFPHNASNWRVSSLPDDDKQKHHRPSCDGATSLVPTSIAEASRAMAGGKSLGENYAFAGMHHVFDQHSDAVLRISFAPDDKHRLACCSRDSCLSICDLGSNPPYVNAILKGHQGPVCCFEWSISGDQLVSGSEDGSIRIWHTKTGKCLRTMIDTHRSAVLSCTFQPLNNNMVVTGNQKGFLTVFNVSTGKPCCQSERIVAISVSPGAAAVTKPAVAAFSLRRVSLGEKQSSSKGGVTSAITAMAFDDAVNPGAILWVGTESGAIVAVGFDIRTGGILSKTKRTVHISSFVIPEGGATGATSATPQFAETAITSLQTKTWLSREARDPTLLANAGSNTLLLFRVLTKPQGALQLRRSISLSSSPKRPLSSKSEALASLPIRSNFCPLMSFSEGACVISGSLDCSVYFFDVERDSTRPCVNRLLGHAAPTLDVAFNYDESLLASCDASGLVIIWKREKK